MQPRRVAHGDPRVLSAAPVSPGGDGRRAKATRPLCMPGVPGGRGESPPSSCHFHRPAIWDGDGLGALQTGLPRDGVSSPPRSLCWVPLGGSVFVTAGRWGLSPGFSRKLLGTGPYCPPVPLPGLETFCSCVGISVEEKESSERWGCSPAGDTWGGQAVPPGSWSPQEPCAAPGSDAPGAAGSPSSVPVLPSPGVDTNSFNFRPLVLLRRA